MAAGCNVTIADLDQNYNGSPDPNNFDVVIILDGEGYDFGMPDPGQTAIVNFVQNGGGLIIFEWVAYEYSAGRYQLMGDLIPIPRSSGAEASETWTVIETHPVTDGVASSFTVLGGHNIGTCYFWHDSSQWK